MSKSTAKIFHTITMVVLVLTAISSIVEEHFCERGLIVNSPESVAQMQMAVLIPHVLILD